VNRIKYGQTKSRMDLKSELTIAICSFGSVFLASQALAHISFPIQALMKSSKIISILIVAPLVRSKEKFTISQYICGFIITTGIVLFYLTDEKKSAAPEHNDLIGILLISASLFCDGLLGTRQSEAKKKFNPSSWDQMESLNKWCSIICLLVAVASGQMRGFLQFVSKYPEVVKDIFFMTILGTTGQIFIFYTIFNFSPLILSIITTTRKFFTVIFSVVLHGHLFNTSQWISVALVFSGVFFEMISGDKHKKKPVTGAPGADGVDHPQKIDSQTQGNNDKKSK